MSVRIKMSTMIYQYTLIVITEMYMYAILNRTFKFTGLFWLHGLTNNLCYALIQSIQVYV